MSTETRLLALCARTELDEAHQQAIQTLLHKEIDWQVLHEYAGHMGVLPLLQRSLMQTSGGRAGDRSCACITDDSVRIAQKNLAISSELFRILERFDGRGLPFIVFKGPELALRAYGDLSLRQYNDLDLLVQRQDRKRGLELLVELGYELDDDWRSNAKLGKPFLLRKSDSGTTVELHWQLVGTHNVVPFDHDAIFRRASKLPFSGSEIKVLSAEDMLIYLCVHGHKHRWERLIWICDIAEFVHRNPGIDWDVVRDRARALGALRLVRIGLTLTEKLLESPCLAAARLGREKDPAGERLVRETLARFEELYQHAIPEPERQSFQIRGRERFRDRARLLASIMRRRVVWGADQHVDNGDHQSNGRANAGLFSAHSLSRRNLHSFAVLIRKVISSN